MIKRILQDFVNNTFLKIYLISQFLTRIALLIFALVYEQINITDIPGILLIGFFNDFVSALYVLPLILIFIALFGFKVRISKGFAFLTSIAFFFVISILTFNLVAEVIFWDEYGTKFNFIAVDYLVYTHEIIGTLRDSLPIIPLLGGIIGLALITTIIFYRYLKNSIANINNYSNIIIIIISFISIILVHNIYSPKMIEIFSNRYSNELALNGPYELFSAFSNNDLDYNKFYPKISKDESITTLKQNVLQGNQVFVKGASNPIMRKTSYSNHFKKYNIVMIVVESLSADFMKRFGQKHEITPYLDQLVEQSLFFDNIYAVGTRTVRGLEALTLSVPPTPGTSIVRKKKNKNLFNIGGVFKNRGYDVKFLYGGYSYFDNMYQFFKDNQFKVIDRTDLSRHEISFANIWGVADEDLFNKTLQHCDMSAQSKKPFFSMVMTTSNHRPYTFPKGRIDLPSGGGRHAGVKYTDYAIGRFIEQAKSKPWFDNTIFVITADHCAGSAGKTHLPIHKYHIPLFVYAPHIIKPALNHKLGSQIDVPPTILGLLNMDYKSQFFGMDLVNYDPNRAFISTYQLLGYYRDKYLTILSPQQAPILYDVTDKDEYQAIDIEDDLQALVNEAISNYQSAYYFYLNGLFQRPAIHEKKKYFEHDSKT